MTPLVAGETRARRSRTHHRPDAGSDSSFTACPPPSCLARKIIRTVIRNVGLGAFVVCVRTMEPRAQSLHAGKNRCGDVVWEQFAQNEQRQTEASRLRTNQSKLNRGPLIGININELLSRSESCIVRCSCLSVLSGACVIGSGGGARPPQGVFKLKGVTFQGEGLCPEPVWIFWRLQFLVELRAVSDERSLRIHLDVGCVVLFP